MSSLVLLSQRKREEALMFDFLCWSTLGGEKTTSPSCAASGTRAESLSFAQLRLGSSLCSQLRQRTHCVGGVCSVIGSGNWTWDSHGRLCSHIKRCCCFRGFLSRDVILPSRVRYQTKWNWTPPTPPIALSCSFLYSLSGWRKKTPSHNWSGSVSHCETPIISEANGGIIDIAL